MPPEELRTLIVEQIDATLSRWGVGAKSRAYLTGFRNYVQQMSADELAKLGTFLPTDIRFIGED